MKKFTLVFLSFCFFSPVAAAQLLGPDPYYQPQVSGVEDLGAEDQTADNAETAHAGSPAEEQLNRAERGELSLSSAEARDLYNGFFALAMGTSDAWQLAGVSGTYFNTRDWNAGGSVGGGPWRFTGERSSRRYEIDLMSRTLGGHVRYFFSERHPFYVQSGTGLSLFSGYVKPVGADGQEDESQSEADASLRSGFRATGVYLSQQFGWQACWEFGLVMEVAIVGFGHTWLVQRSFTKSANAAKSAVDDELEGFSSWGLLNLKIGWLF